MGVAGANPHDEDDPANVRLGTIRVPREKLDRFTQLMDAGGAQAVVEALKRPSQGE